MISLFARAASAVAVGAALVLVAAPASAHFDLMSPASWSVDNPADGAPEKLGPCGNEPPDGKPAGTLPTPAVDDAGLPVVTAVQEGDMITVTIKEVVFHPGHYRISLSTDWADAGDTVQAGFPPDPLVSMGKTNSGTMVCPGAPTAICGSVPIEQGPFPVAVPGVGWVLADDVFEHCAQFTTAQTIKVALPPGVSCKECVLQVLEFMSDHGLNNPGGCFYHHCANLSIAGQSVPVEGGTSSGATSGAASGASSTGTSGDTSGAATGSSGSATTGSVGATSGTVSAGSVIGTTGVGTTSGTSPPTTGSASPSGASSGTSTGPAGSGTPAPATKSGGCAISPRRASSWAGLVGLALAVALTRRRRARR
jgi:hypothetical protein